MTDVEEITPRELQDLLDEGADVRVVDIRSPQTFVQGHIPGSENVPFRRLTTVVEQFADADHVVTVCPHGNDSVRAARLIRSYEGTDGRVESLQGGLTAWNGRLVVGEDATTGDESDGPAAPF